MRDASRQWLRPIVFGTQQLVYPPTVMPQETIRVPIDASEFPEVHFWLVRENGRNEVIAYAERWIDTLRETNGKDLQKTLERVLARRTPSCCCDRCLFPSIQTG